jgi:transcriptional regulator with XRE-family HTH domain
VEFFKKNLRSLREGLGLSLPEFGKLIGKTGQSVHLYENGQGSFRVADLQKLEDLGINAIDFVMGRSTVISKLPFDDVTAAIRAKIGRAA